MPLARQMHGFHTNRLIHKFQFALEPEVPSAGHPRRTRDGLGASGAAREAAELEDLTRIGRHRVVVPKRAHGVNLAEGPTVNDGIWTSVGEG